MKWNVFDARFVKIGQVEADSLDEAMQLAVRYYSEAKHILRVRP